MDDDSVANVQQQVHEPPVEMPKALAILRNAAAELPTEAREEAEDAIDGLEEESKAEKPRAGRIRGYARTLNTHLLTFGPVVATIVKLILGGG